MYRPGIHSNSESVHILSLGEGWKSGDSLNFETEILKPENGNLNFKIEFRDFDPNEIELYLYLNGTDFNRPQMIFLQSSSFNFIQG